jgi:hypothetical protein
LQLQVKKTESLGGLISHTLGAAKMNQLIADHFAVWFCLFSIFFFCLSAQILVF